MDVVQDAIDVETDVESFDTDVEVTILRLCSFESHWLHVLWNFLVLIAPPPPLPDIFIIVDLLSEALNYFYAVACAIYSAR